MGRWGIVYDEPELFVGWIPERSTSNLHPTADLSLVFERLHAPLESFFESKQDVLSDFRVDQLKEQSWVQALSEETPSPDKLTEGTVSGWVPVDKMIIFRKWM